MTYVIHLVDDDVTDETLYLCDVGEDEDTGRPYAVWSCLDDALEFPTRTAAEHHAHGLTVVGVVETLPC